jgi:aminoglycoside phosphotransferase (APT) family kinase protein
LTGEVSAALAVLADVNRQHGARYVLAGRLAGGHQAGAYLLNAPGGGVAVLKWSADRFWASQVLRAAPAVERVRSAGYPTPAWLAVGVTAAGYPYQIQQFVPGAALVGLGPHEVDLLLDLVERQRGLDPDPGRDWSAHIWASVFEDVDGVARWLRAHSSDAARLVETYAALCAPFRRESLPTGDLVHGDLSTHNVLAERGRVTGVVDIEALGSGTRVVDLAAILREGYLWQGDAGALRRLRKAAEAVAGHGALTVCVAASVLGVLTFVLRHRPNTAGPLFAAAHRLAADLARPLRRR